MAVFNDRFENLPDAGRWAYLIALGLLVLAMALLMRRRPTIAWRSAGRFPRDD